MASDPGEDIEHLESADAGESLVLADLVNRVLDKGVVISGSVIIGIADIDLVKVSLGLVISSTETELQRTRAAADDEEMARHADVPVLPPRERR